MSGNVSDSTRDAPKSKDTPAPKSKDAPKSTESDDVETVTESFGACSINPGNQAKPVQETDDSKGSTDKLPSSKACMEILSDRSLNSLAAALPPNDANRLFVLLGIRDAILKQEQANNHRDVVQKQFQILRHWSNKNASRDVEVSVADLLKRLSEIGRNDIMGALENALAAERCLTDNDWCEEQN